MPTLISIFLFMRKQILASLAGALFLVGAGCSNAVPAQPVAQAPVQAMPVAQAPAEPASDAHLSFIRGSLAAANLTAYKEEAESDAAEMKSASSISAATKFKFSGGKGSVRLLVVAVKSPAELAAVTAEIKQQYETLQKLSSSARIAWLAGDATHAVVSNWKVSPEDDALAAQVIAALGGSAAPAAVVAPVTDEKLPADTEKAAAAKATFKVGDTVVARWKAGTRWWDAKVTAVSGDEVTVKYSDGVVEVLPPLLVAHLNQPNSSIAAGQEVLAKWSDGKYYSGFVQSFDDSTVTVKWKDGSSPSKLPYSSVELPGR